MEISNQTTFRKNTKAFISNTIRHVAGSNDIAKMDPDTLIQLASNIEIATYNRTIRIADDKQIAKSWSNQAFTTLYSSYLRSVINNIKRDRMIHVIADNAFDPSVIESGTIDQFNPEKWEPVIKQTRMSADGMYEMNAEASSDDFVCKKPKCRSKRCSHYQMQTRSADEPMTTYVTCLDCGNRYRC